MTYHGTAWSSLQNAIARANGRASHRKLKRKKYIRDPEAYARAIEEGHAAADHHGIPRHPVRRDEFRAGLKLASAQGAKRPVSLARTSVDEPAPLDERAVAEDRVIDVVTAAVNALTFQLEELTQIPNQSLSYKNRVNQAQLIAVIRRLACSVTPPVPTSFSPAMLNEKVRTSFHNGCINCGGPARENIAGYWYCEDCREER